MSLGDGGEAGFYATMKVVRRISPALNSSSILGVSLNRKCQGLCGHHGSLSLPCQVSLAQWEVSSRVRVPGSGWQRRVCWCLLWDFKRTFIEMGMSAVLVTAAASPRAVQGIFQRGVLFI